jgi:hypothetical protein
MYGNVTMKPTVQLIYANKNVLKKQVKKNFKQRMEPDAGE